MRFEAETGEFALELNAPQLGHDSSKEWVDWYTVCEAATCSVSVLGGIAMGRLEPITQDVPGQRMPLKIGVMGSASPDHVEKHLQKARQLGQAIATTGCVTITGACPGLPLAAAQGASEAGGTVIGISPGLSLDEHVYKYYSPAEFHDVLIFTGSGLMGREVVNIRSSDIVVIVGGSSGTLGELAIAYDEGKLIGVLTGTGGITDVIPKILEACQKETGARVIYDMQPANLMEKLLHVYRTEHFRQPSCFCVSCETSDAESGFATVRDPVCGMWLDPQRAVASRKFNKHTAYFCCSSCASAFDVEPAK